MSWAGTGCHRAHCGCRRVRVAWLAAAVRPSKLSSTAREYVNGLSFSSRTLNLEFWCQVFLSVEVLYYLPWL